MSSSLEHWVATILAGSSFEEFVGFSSTGLTKDEKLIVLIYYIVSRQRYDITKMNKKEKFYVSFIKKSMEKLFNDFEFDFHWIELWDMC